MPLQRPFHNTRYKGWLWVVGLMMLVCWSPSFAEAQTVSFSFRVPSSGVASRRALRRQFSFLLRARGNRVSSGIVRKGYHFINSYRQTVINRPRLVPTCNVVVYFRVVYMPGRRYVYKGRARGTTNYSRYIRLTRKQRKGLCKDATRLALKKLSSSVRNIVRAVERQRRGLGKNRILGQAFRGSLRGGLFGGSRAGGVQDGKPLRGRKPRLKWAPPAMGRSGT